MIVRTHSIVLWAFASLFTLLVIPPVFGGEIPESAHSRSLSIRPEFLDYTTLVYQYPQHASRIDPELYSSNRDYSPGDLGVGIIGRKNRNGFFFLMQETPRWMPGGTTLYQAGWGIGWDALQFGLAVRGAYKSVERNDQREVDGEQSRITYSGSLNKTIEGVFGIGIRRSRFALDLTIDYIDPSSQHDYLEHRSWSSESETSATHYKDLSDPSWMLNGRTTIRISEQSELILIGSWGRPEYDIEETLYSDSLISTRISGSNELWTGGIAVSFSTRHIDRLILSAKVQRGRNTGISYPRYSRRGSIQTEERDFYWLAASMQHQVAERLIMRAGAEARYQKSIEERKIV